LRERLEKARNEAEGYSAELVANRDSTSMAAKEIKKWEKKREKEAKD